MMKAVLDAPVEHHDAVVIGYDNGSIGTMSGGSTHLGAGGDRHQLEVRAIGSEGAADDRPRARRVLALPRRRPRGAARSSRASTCCYDCDGPPNTLIDLAQGKDVVNYSPGELGARTVEILDAAYRSARSGKLEATVR